MAKKVPRRTVDVAQLERDGDLRGLVRALEDSSADGATKADAAKALGTFAGATAANKVPYTTAAAATAAVVMANALPPLVELLRSGSDDGRAVAAGALGILAGGAVGVMPVIVSAGALPPLVAMLSSGSEDGSKLYAAQALGVLAGGNVRIKSFVVGAGAIPQLVAMLSGGSDEGKRHASTALANLIPAPRGAVDIAQTELEYLRWVVQKLENASTDDADKASAAAVLGTYVQAGNTSANKAPNITAATATTAVVAAGALPPLVELLRSGSDDGKGYAAGALGMLADGNVDIMPVIVAVGALPPLVVMLSSGSEDGSKLYAVRALGVLAGGNVGIAAAVVAAGGIPPLVELLHSGSDEGKRHAWMALASLLPVLREGDPKGWSTVLTNVLGS